MIAASKISFSPCSDQIYFQPQDFYRRGGLRTAETVGKNGLVPRVLPVKWHITKEKYDRK